MNNNNEFLSELKEQCMDECLSKGICSQSPVVTYIHEVLGLQLRELSFYLLRLKSLGINNEKIKEDFIETVSSIVVGVNFSESDFLRITQKFSAYIKEAKDLYISMCNKNNLQCEFLRTKLKFPKKLNYPEAIKFGQRLVLNKSEELSQEQRILFEMISHIIKSISMHIIELQDMGIQSELFYDKLLAGFDLMNLFKINLENLQQLALEFAIFDHSLITKLHETRQEKYGFIKPAEIPTSTRENKAILVSGTNLHELELILEATKNKNIDIYTHGNMILAYCFPKFRTYKNLAGHFGKNSETYMIDFAEFPGPILVTRHSMQRTENLFRSRIFTTDPVAPKSVTVIKNNDFSTLIETALQSKGFTKNVAKPPIKTELDENKIIADLEKITDGLVTGEIKHVFIIGVTNRTKKQQDYFKRFLSIMDKNCLVISFSYYEPKKNIIKIDSEYGFPLFYKALDLFAKKIPINELNITVINTRCEAHTISNIIYLKHLGIKNIYFEDCPPSMVNPSLISEMRKIYGLKTLSNPDIDYRTIISG